MSYASSSLTSPSSPAGIHKSIPAGFLPFRRPQHKRLDQLSHRELLERYAQNKNILNQPIASTSNHHQRVIAEQAAIEEILGMEALQEGMARTHITEVDDPMGATDTSPHLPQSQSRAVETKRRLIERYYGGNTKQRGATKALGLDEAMALEQKANLAALERKKQEEERQQQCGLPRPGEYLTREERAARIWTYMNAKPSESDEEDQDWNEEDEIDPSRWFDYDEDDGKQGQPLVDPDEIADIIRVDYSHWE